MRKLLIKSQSFLSNDRGRKLPAPFLAPNFKLRPFFSRRRMPPRNVVVPGGGDAEGLLPSRSQPAAFAHESIGIGGGVTPSASPSREHHHPTPLTPRRASGMLRGAASAAAAPTRQAISSVLSSWVSRRFLGGLAVILPIAVSLFATAWFLNFFDRLFAPLLEALLGFRVVGLGFATSMLFILATGVVASSYVGGALISLGEWVIRRLPLVKHVFSAAKQISAAISPSGVEGGEHGVGGGSFRECVLVKNPRLGNFMLAFVTGATRLRGAASDAAAAGSQAEGGSKERDLDLVAVYAATNHFVFGDVFLVPRSEVIRTNLSVREGIEIIVSMGMALPKELVAMT